MSKVFGIVPHLHIEYLDEEALLFVKEGEYLVVEGALPISILHILEAGETRLSSLQEGLKENWEPGIVEEVVGFMLEDQLLEVKPTEIAPETLRRWHTLPYPAEGLSHSLAGSGVEVSSIGHTYPSIGAALERWGVQNGGDECRLAVVTTLDVLDERLREINRQYIEQHTPWLLAKIDAHSCWMTLFVPGRTPSCDCFARSVGENRGLDQPLTRPVPEVDPHIMDGYAERIAQVVVTFLVEGTHSRLEGFLEVQRHPFGASTFHPIRKSGRAQNTSARKEEESPLWDADLLNYSGGRRYSLDEAYARAIRLVSPYTGIFRNLEPLPVFSEQLGFVYGIKHRMARPRLSKRVLSANTGGRSFGKGETPLNAQVSALYEGMERYSGIWRDEYPRMRSTLGDLIHPAIKPASFLGFSERQYDQREALNEANPHVMLYIPDRYSVEEEIDWVDGWSLTHKAHCYLPAALSFYDHPDAKLGFAVSDSNGCASGGTYAEAVWSGLMEVIERDAVAIWWYNRLPCPAVDLSAIDEPYVRRQPGIHDELGRDLWVLNVTHDMGIPVFVGVSKDRVNPSGWALGFGCDPNPLAALKSALLELGQVLSAEYMRQEPADAFAPGEDEDALAGPVPWMMPAPDLPAVRLEDLPPAPGTLKDIIARLAELKLDVIVLDQTRPDIGIPVVKTIVPGCCHHWRRLGTPRLYTVPVKMRQLPHPHKEEELNPISLIL